MSPSLKLQHSEVMDGMKESVKPFKIVRGLLVWNLDVRRLYINLVKSESK